MSDALFDLDDFAETARPALARETWPCNVHDRISEDDAHARDCWGGVCPSCREDVVNGWMMRLNHSGAESGECTSLGLRLNHLTYDIRHGDLPAPRDMTVLDLGWRIAPDGSQIPPAGAARPRGWDYRHGDRTDFLRWTGVAA